MEIIKITVDENHEMNSEIKEGSTSADLMAISASCIATVAKCHNIPYKTVLNDVKRMIKESGRVK